MTRPAAKTSRAQKTVTGSIRRALAENGKVERQPISLRLRHGLRDRVWGAALGEKKPLNTMVNDLLERGLDARQPLEQVFGSVAGFAVARALLASAEAAVAKNGTGDRLWLRDPELFEKAATAIIRTLETLRPGAAQDALVRVATALHQMKPPTA